jgi:hypothetical protein
MVTVLVMYKYKLTLHVVYTHYRPHKKAEHDSVANGKVFYIAVVPSEFEIPVKHHIFIYGKAQLPEKQEVE